MCYILPSFFPFSSSHAGAREDWPFLSSPQSPNSWKDSNNNNFVPSTFHFEFLHLGKRSRTITKNYTNLLLPTNLTNSKEESSTSKINSSCSWTSNRPFKGQQNVTSSPPLSLVVIPVSEHNFLLCSLSEKRRHWMFTITSLTRSAADPWQSVLMAWRSARLSFWVHLHKKGKTMKSILTMQQPARQRHHQNT